MANQIALGSLSYLGGSVVEASDGTKVAVFRTQLPSVLVVYKNIDGTPSLVASGTATAMFGGGNVDFVRAAIDGNDDVHVIASCDSDQTRGVAYAVCDLTTGFGSWEGWAYTEGTPGSPNYTSCDIAIDSNGYPHVCFTDLVKQAGATHQNVYYSERTGGSWSGVEQVGVRTDKEDYYWRPEMVVCAANDVEVFMKHYDDSAVKNQVAYRRRNGSWGTESYYTPAGGSYSPGGLLVTTGDVVYRTFTDTAENIYENDVDTGYDIWNGGYDFPALSTTLVNDSTRYIFYQDASDQIQVIYNSGGGWVDGGVFQQFVEWVVSEWAYNFENQAGAINYIFKGVGGYIYYDSLSVADPIAPIIRRTGQNPFSHLIGR